MSTIYLESTVSSGGAKPAKEDPHHKEKVELLGVSLPSAQSRLSHHIAGMAGRQSSRRLPPT